MSDAKKWFLQVAGVCAFLGPIVMVVADSLNIFGGQAFVSTIIMWFAFVLIVPGLIGFSYVLAAEGSKLAFIGGILAYCGAMAGAAMQVLFRVHAVLGETGSTAAIAYYRQGSAGFIHPVLLAIGAVLFPVGRIGGFVWAVMASDILIMIAFMTIGRKVMAAANTSRTLSSESG